MFTFVIEAFYPSIHVWLGGDGLRLFDVVERAIRDIYPPQLDLVKFLAWMLHLVLSTQLTQYRGSFFQVHLGFVHWSWMTKRIGRSWAGCARFTCVTEFRRCSQVSRPLHWWRFWGPGFKENHSQRVALSSERLKSIHQNVFHRDQQWIWPWKSVSLSRTVGSLMSSFFFPQSTRRLTFTVACLEIRTIIRVWCRAQSEANSLVSYEQTLQSSALSRRSNSSDWSGHGEITMTEISIEPVKCCHWLVKKTLVGDPTRVKRSPLCTKFNIPGIYDSCPFQELSSSIWSLYRDFCIVSASQLWLVPLLRISLDLCFVSRSHKIDGGDRIECLLFDFS